jgi:hypothetical protein
MFAFRSGACRSIELHFRSNQIKSNQIKSNQIRSDQKALMAANALFKPASMPTSGIAPPPCWKAWA